LFDIAFNFINAGAIKHRVIELKVNNTNIYPLSLFLKKHTGCLYKTLVDIVAYDRPGKHFRFSTIYNLLSVGYNSRLLLITKITEKSPVLPSLVPLYAGASWLEREV
jgi:NADH:ubiquinone oxidoreductase subunit C